MGDDCMDFNAARVRQLLEQADFVRLFVEELGWDRHSDRFELTVADETFSFRAVAEKKGATAFVCDVEEVPQKALRLKIDREISKRAFEHIVVFLAQGGAQVWNWPRRLPDRPVSLMDHSYRPGEQNTAFLQRLRGISFSLAEENDLTLPDVTKRLDASLNAERVTRRFFAEFSTEHKKFLEFIGGITEVADREWYASLMLNRLMFIYFMQRKGFLDGNVNYLRDKLVECQHGRGRHAFYPFYRYFLLRLFHEGLGGKERNAELERLIGRVPYLNGGLFEKHLVEERNPDIQIPDAAFERIFDYFDRYKWHLDERPLRDENEINPDVLGYIFEKYINQKQMGAYYTKEDITGHITQNTVIPFLLDAAKPECRVAFENPGGPTAWDHLREEPDRYIYQSVRHGMEHLLPDNIAAGVGDVSRRTEWNRGASEEFGLPTEIWREVVARRTRCEELRSKLASGEVHEVNDLITLNLDIRQFAQDVIERAEGPDLLRAVWKAVERVTVLDPTCGSGAFLFAALNVLEPLYEACLDRMDSFVTDFDRSEGGKTSKRYEDFRRVLARVEAHPNRRYFILKSIILNNLFGVDIMEEAVEICKLRLFLKLAAQVEPDKDHDNLGIEPLPDIDFNVRAGNTLVGYATYAEAQAALRSSLDLHNSAERIDSAAADLQQAEDLFRERQTEGDGSVPAADKALVRERLQTLNEELNRYLAAEYGVNTADTAAFDTWLRGHDPFHWFVEFRRIMSGGGFDVIIGNPPYAEVPKTISRPLLRRTYTSALERWSRDEDLCTLVVERSLTLLASTGQFGMILPLSVAFSTKRPFVRLREVVADEKGLVLWSHFDRIPSALFGNEVRTRCTILLTSRSRPRSDFQMGTTSLKRWNAEARNDLFPLLNYAAFDLPIATGVPKVGSAVQSQTLKDLRARYAPLSADLRDAISFRALAEAAPNFPQPAVYIGGTAYNWFPAWREIPPTTDVRGKPSLPARTAGYRFPDESRADVAFALLCSSMGYWWWSVASDGFNLKKWLTDGFPVSSSAFSEQDLTILASLGSELRSKLLENYVYKDNRGRIGNYYLPACYDLVEKIDTAIARSDVGISAEFMADIREHNSIFSRASASEDGEEVEDDGVEDE